MGLTPAHIEYFPGGGLGMFPCPKVKVAEVVYPEYVPYLFAVAVNCDWLAQHSGQCEPSYPALVLNAELSGAVDAGLAKDRGAETEYAGVVPHILVRGALGATVGGMKVQRCLFGNPGIVFLKVVARSTFVNGLALRFAVNLVGRGKQESGLGGVNASGLEEGEGAEGVRAEVEGRVAYAGGYCHLSRLMGDAFEGTRLPKYFFEKGGVCHVALTEAEFVPVALVQPIKIRGGAWTRKVVQSPSFVSRFDGALHEVSADKAGASGYECLAHNEKAEGADMTRTLQSSCPGSVRGFTQVPKVWRRRLCNQRIGGKSLKLVFMMAKVVL